MRNMICSYCEIELKSRDIESHMEFCASRRERCKGCTKHVQKKFLQFHYENDHKYMTPEEKGDAEGSEGDEGEECPVCLGPITYPIALECGHVFCMVCVKGIANTTKNCAICRRDINRDMLMDIRFCREEDVIKNYVKNSKCKKYSRSKSVPSRSNGSMNQAGARTADYDSMVSALLSNRSSSSSYRYDRPTNTHTPPTYTPYCYATSSSTLTAPSTSSYNCRPNSVSSYVENGTSYRSVTEAKHEFQGRNSTIRHTMYESSLEGAICNTVSSGEDTSIINASSSSEARPRRPTSLALSSSSQEDTGSPKTDLPQLSQEEYDRWLAFQLSQCEDDIPPEEFNKRHKNPMRRCISMPESKNSSSSYITENDDPDKHKRKDDDGHPPVVPRSSTSSSPTKSPASEADNIEMSPVESPASGNTNVINTGARPKCPTGLRKRVSFREEAPPKRKAPVMLPCEFCNEMFCERDLMRHQTSCDFNETKNPREYLLSRRSSAASNVSSPTSPISTSSPISPTASPSSSNLPPLPSGSHSEKNVKLIYHNVHKTPPPSPLSRPRNKVTNNTTVQPPSTNINKHRSAECIPNKAVKSAGLSPESGQSATSGICSATCSFSSSVSTTPSTSSSASPVPASTTPDTPTDADAELEEDNVSLRKPRRGKFLKSAISSWRSISGSRIREKPKFLRSNALPSSESNEEFVASKQLSTNEPSVIPPSHSKNGIVELGFEGHTTDQHQTENFIKNKKSYKAPLPPPVSLFPENNENGFAQPEDQLTYFYDTNKEESNNIRFDSMPIMNGQLQIREDIYHCKNCQQPFTLRKLKCHQTVCKKDENECRIVAISNTKETVDLSNTKENHSAFHRKYRKGPAPQPPKEENVEYVESLFRRSGSLRSQNRSSYAIESRLERRSSVKESKISEDLEDTSTFLTSPNWISREVLFGRGTVESSEDYSGNGSISSSTTSLNSLPGNSVSKSSVGYFREKLRSARASTSLGLSDASVLLGTSNYRERSLSRSRPSSLYSSRGDYMLHGVHDA